MKGTNNLLVFAVNEFIIDYVSQLREHIYSQTAADNPKISAYQSCIDDIYNNVKDHKFRDVEVVEYWDETEYMNISCETTSRAVNANLVNDRYFEQYVENVGGEYVV